jgi:proline iminopeptidase
MVCLPLGLHRHLTNIPSRALAFARIESHYFVNGGFYADGQLIADAHRIAHLPIVIVQGRYDVVCPAATSWALYKALGGAQNPNVEYHVVADAGHSASERGIEIALMEAIEKFKTLKA